MFDIRLQGGPFDGKRLRTDEMDELPAMIWVERCAVCLIHAIPKRTPKGEKYRRDDQEIDGWHIYVFTDERIGVSDNEMAETQARR